MNELLFFSHVIVVLAFILIALKLGREWLMCCFAFQMILANLLVFKQIHFFGLTMTCTEMLTIGSILSLNLLQEYFGKEAAKRAVWVSFFTLIFFAAMSQLHLLYIPSPHDTNHQAYRQILMSGPRVILASLGVTLLVQRLDMAIYGFLQKKLSEKRIILRSFGSLSLSQLIDTVLFSYIGLWGLVHNIFHIILVSYLIKMLVILTMTPFTALTKRFISPIHDNL